MDSRLTPSPADTAATLGLDVNGIMWTDATVNPGLFGCAKVSPACTNCYVEMMAARIRRMGGDEPNPAGPAVRYAQGLTDDGRWTGRVVVMPEQVAPSFAKIPWTTGKVRRVFVTSMSDLFHEDVPFDFIDAVFAEMAGRPQAFQVLTKRAERMAEYAADRARRGLVWPANVWAGVTVEDQRRADERIPFLLRVPAVVRFLSVEPMVGPVDLDKLWCHNCDTDEHVHFEPPAQPWCWECDSEVGGAGWLDSLADRRQAGINWVLCGGESGRGLNVRPMHPAWARSLRDQCVAAGVAFHFKQWGAWAPAGSVDTYSHGPNRDQRRYPDSEGIAWLADGRVCKRDFTVAQHAARMRTGEAHSTRAIEVDEQALADWHRAAEMEDRTAYDRMAYQWMYRIGKHAAGRVLDGRTWDELPGISNG